MGRESVAAEALGRIVASSMSNRSAPLMDLTNRLAARLAWTLQGVAPPAHLQSAQEMVLEAVKSAKKHLKDTEESHAPESMAQLTEKHPLVTSCLAL